MMNEKKFWQWFEDNQSKYLHLDDLDERNRDLVLDQFLKRLHEYCDGLFFQIGGNPSEKEQELVISAEGNAKYFSAVEELISAAPNLDNWKFIAFKQPQGTDFVTRYEGLLLDPKKMWFLPLNNEQNPGMIGLRICIDNYNLDNTIKVKQAVYQVLDTILGEKAAALDIDYLDIDKLSAYDPEKDGLIELVELQDYITWKKSKVVKK